AGFRRPPLDLRALGGDEDARHFRARELVRRLDALREELAHLRAGERDTVVGAVRAGLARSHALAALAVEAVLEEQRRDAELLRVELIEDQMRVVRPVVIPDAGVVAAHDEVRAAVVLAHNRVEDRLTRLCARTT